MKVEYKACDTKVQWWVVDMPADGPSVSTEAMSTRKGTTTIEALALVKTSLVVKFTKDLNVTNAKNTLDTFAPGPSFVFWESP